MIKEKILFWVNAIFYIVLGCFMMFKPDLALETVVIIFGIESILSGIAGIVLVIKNKESEDRGLLAGLSIFQILVGVALAFFPGFGETIIRIFIVLIGIGVVIRGILLVIDSIRLKKIKFDMWYWALIAGCCLIIFGVFLVLNSLLTILIINSVIGFCMVIAGISMIIWVFQLKSAVKKELRA